MGSEEVIDRIEQKHIIAKLASGLRVDGRKFNEIRKSKIVSVSNLLPSILKEFNMEESFVIEIIKKRWKDIVDKLTYTHSYPDRIYKNILFISVDNPIFLNEITMMKSIILEKLKKECGFINIRDIRVEQNRKLRK